MPVFDVELDDGRTITLEADSEPTEDDIFSALSSYQPAADVPASFEPPTSNEWLTKPPDYLPQTPEQFARQHLTPESESGSLLEQWQQDVGPQMIPTGPEMTKATGIPKALTIPASAVAKLGAGVVAYITSPEGAAMTAGTATPAAPFIFAKWAYDMIKGGVESAKDIPQTIGQMISEAVARNMVAVNELGQVPEGKSTDEHIQTLAEDAVNMAGMLLGGVGAGKHAVTSGVNRIATIKQGMESVIPRGQGIGGLPDKPTIKSSPIDSSLIVEPIKETGGVTSDPLTPPVSGEQPLVPTPGKPAPVAEPWQMRKTEGDSYLDKQMINAVKTDKGRIIAKNVEHGDLMPALEESGSTFNNQNARGWALVGRKPSESYIGIADVNEAKGDFHKAYVMKAIREGKSVPPEVLADYPDLKQPPAPQPETKPAKPPTTLQELDALVIQHGIETGRLDDLETLHAPKITDTSGLGSMGLAAKRRYSEQIKAARQRIASDLGIAKEKLETPEGRAEILAKLKERIAEIEKQSKPKGGELDLDIPLTLTGEKTKFVEPTKETTAFGGETLSQSDLFGIEEVTREVDPFKSANAAERMYGDEAVAKIENQLRVMDSDPQVRKSFTKQQRERLKEVLNLLRQRAEEKTKGDIYSEGAGKVSDWTSATEDIAEVAAEPGKPEPPQNIIEMGAGIPIPKFADRKMSPLDRVTTSHSGKLQKSFSEARLAQNEIKKFVPSERRQNAISIWREANGDLPTLQAWAAAAKGKMFKQAAIDAQTLTPKEIGIARKAITAFDVLEKRGNTFDVLKSHRDNYIPHVWDVKKPGTGFGTGMLKQRFRFSKARTFDTFFDGDQAGFKPKTLAIGKLLPAYIHEMNRVIADRQAGRDFATGTMKDGSPMGVQRGNVKVVDGPEGKAVLVQPKAMREVDTSDYRVMPDQPALSNWTWEGKDTDGKPVFVKADLALHPDAYRRLNAMIGQSALRTWYHDPVTGAAQIPRAIVRGLDTAQSAMKREMFGLLAPFHQVQEGWHGIAHRINPLFGLEKIDLVKNTRMVDAANHGLMLLPDRASAQVYMEGVGTRSSLLSQGLRKIPILKEQIPFVKKSIADVIDWYQDYLFHQYIPALKFKTYEAMVERNTKLYAKELASGEMTKADIKLTSAEQSNAAYGHLNYALLDRNPTIQHLIQLSLLAPDFLEARARFAGQAVKGARSKVGTEQLKAIAFIAAVQAGSAFLISQLLGVPYDKEHPFEVIYKGRRFALRSVPEDIFGLVKDTRQFVYSRVNPLTVKGGVQLATGLNYRGEKVSATDTMGELLAGYIPITARSIPGVRSLTETGRQSPITPLQQLAGSLGLRVSRYSPISETYKLAGDWMDSQKLDKDRGSYPISKYQQLRYALEDGDMERAKSEYETLRKEMTAKKISDGFEQSINHPFTGSQSNDKSFARSLNGYDFEIYNQALRNRRNILSAFKRL